MVSSYIEGMVSVIKHDGVEVFAKFRGIGLIWPLTPFFTFRIIWWGSPQLKD
jgi:hypothetical protein